jgi:hypothetical protein
MDGLAIAIGSTICATLFMAPVEACSEASHMRFVGAAAMMLALMGISVPLTLKLARKLHRPPLPMPQHPKQPYRPLPPGPIRR